MHAGIPEIEEQRHRAGCGCRPARAARAVFLFYLVAALLNADALERGASRMPYGRGRDVCLRVTAPLARVGHVLRLTALRRAVERRVRGSEAEA